MTKENSVQLDNQNNNAASIESLANASIKKEIDGFEEGESDILYTKFKETVNDKLKGQYELQIKNLKELQKQAKENDKLALDLLKKTGWTDTPNAEENEKLTKKATEELKKEINEEIKAQLNAQISFLEKQKENLELGDLATDIAKLEICIQNLSPYDSANKEKENYTNQLPLNYVENLLSYYGNKNNPDFGTIKIKIENGITESKIVNEITVAKIPSKNVNNVLLKSLDSYLRKTTQGFISFLVAEQKKEIEEKMPELDLCLMSEGDLPERPAKNTCYVLLLKRGNNNFAVTYKDNSDQVITKTIKNKNLTQLFSQQNKDGCSQTLLENAANTMVNLKDSALTSFVASHRTATSAASANLPAQFFFPSSYSAKLNNGKYAYTLSEEPSIEDCKNFAKLCVKTLKEEEKFSATLNDILTSFLNNLTTTLPNGKVKALNTVDRIFGEIVDNLPDARLQNTSAIKNHFQQECKQRFAACGNLKFDFLNIVQRIHDFVVFHLKMDPHKVTDFFFPHTEEINNTSENTNKNQPE